MRECGRDICCIYVRGFKVQKTYDPRYTRKREKEDASKNIAGVLSPDTFKLVQHKFSRHFVQLVGLHGACCRNKIL